MSLPERLRIQSKELLSCFVVLELNKDRALEELLIGTTKTNGVGRAIRSEESLDIELRPRLFIAESLGIDGSGLCSRLWSGRVVCNCALDLLHSLGARNNEEFAVAESCNDGRLWLEALHASE